MDDVRHIRASATTNAVYPKYRYLFFFLIFYIIVQGADARRSNNERRNSKMACIHPREKEFMAINKYWSVKNDYSLVLTSHVRQ